MNDNYSDNRSKALAGSQLDKFLNEQFDNLKRDGVIKDFKRRVHFSHASFNYEMQFLANFIIETQNDKYIIIRRSNSFRQDRAKIGFYDFDGILKHSAFSGDVIATVYLVPNEEINNSEFLSTREKIKLKEYYCPATHLLTLSEFEYFLEGYRYDHYSTTTIEIEDFDKADVTAMSFEEQGSYYGLRGNQFERQVVNLLLDNRNLKNLKENKKSDNGLYDIIVKKILAEKGLAKEDILQITATNSVPLLLSGGTPKTDIVITLKLSDSEAVETISLKNTNSTRVSCHDYSVIDFLRVLDCKDNRLGDYLKYFQEEPTLKKFEENLPSTFSVEEFTELLTKKEKVFTEWALQGKHDMLNLVSPAVQISNYLLILKNNQPSFYSMSEYIELINEKAKKTFGVPFSWTYPSKQRGKRIQLKLPIID